MYPAVLWTVLSPTGGAFLPTWVLATLLAVPVATAAALVGYGLRESVGATARATLAGAGLVLPLAVVLRALAGEPAWLLPGLLFAPTFALVLRRERARDGPADVARTRGYVAVLFVVALAGLLPSLAWLGVFLLAVLSSPADLLADLDTLVFLGYPATGVLVDGSVCHRILRDGRGRDLVGRAAETPR